MKLKDFVNVINKDCAIDDWKIVTTEGKRVVNNIHKYLDDEVVDIFWDFRLKTEDSSYEVKVISMPIMVITIAHHEVEGVDYEHRFYACFEGYDGKITKVPCNTREEARETISRDGGEYRSIWTE